MINVSVLVFGDFDVSVKKIEESVARVFSDNGISDSCEASVAVVTSEKMLEYVRDYLHEEGEEAASHPVLSFPTSEIEGEFVFPPNGILFLGEIIVSYDHAVVDAKNNNTSVDDAVCELACHGALHLIGVHHD